MAWVGLRVEGLEGGPVYETYLYRDSSGFYIGALDPQPYMMYSPLICSEAWLPEAGTLSKKALPQNPEPQNPMYHVRATV